MVKAAILGYGTVGSGVAEVLSCNQELIAKRAGNPIEVKYILDLRDFPGDPNETKVVHDIDRSYFTGPGDFDCLRDDGRKRTGIHVFQACIGSRKECMHFE